MTTTDSHLTNQFCLVTSRNLIKSTNSAAFARRLQFVDSIQIHGLQIKVISSRRFLFEIHSAALDFSSGSLCCVCSTFQVFIRALAITHWAHFSILSKFFKSIEFHTFEPSRVQKSRLNNLQFLQKPSV